MDKLKTMEEYWDIRSDGFSKGVLDELNEKHGYWKEKMSGLLKDAPEGRVLDIGCGPGIFTIILSELGYGVTAFDFSAEMLAEAKKNAESYDVKAEFMQGDAQNLPFEDGSFAVVVSRNLTWNLEQPERAYREWLRVLKPGGIIINCDGNHYSHYYREEYRLEREQPEYKDGHNPEYLKNIDVSIIDDIARELPLSKELRPTWDISFLINEGVGYAGAEIMRKEFTDAEGIKHSIIKNFILKAQRA